MRFLYCALRAGSDPPGWSDPPHESVEIRTRRFDTAVGRNKRSALRRSIAKHARGREDRQGQRHRPPAAFAPAAQCGSLIAPYGLDADPPRRNRDPPHESLEIRTRRFDTAAACNKRSALGRSIAKHAPGKEDRQGQRHRPHAAFAPVAQCASLIAPYGLVSDPPGRNRDPPHESVEIRTRRFDTAAACNKRSALRRSIAKHARGKEDRQGERHRPQAAFAPVAQCASFIAPYGLDSDPPGRNRDPPHESVEIRTPPGSTPP